MGHLFCLLGYGEGGEEGGGLGHGFVFVYSWLFVWGNDMG